MFTEHTYVIVSVLHYCQYQEHWYQHGTMLTLQGSNGIVPCTSYLVRYNTVFIFYVNALPVLVSNPHFEHKEWRVLKAKLLRKTVQQKHQQGLTQTQALNASLLENALTPRKVSYEARFHTN